MEGDEQQARIARGWDEAALGYDAYYVPRFAPWVDTSVRAVTSAPLPDGPVLVPCCGTFPELDLLVEHLPGRELVGIDLSEGMVRQARQRAAGRPEVSAVVGDATDLGDWAGRCAAVVSVFGLQQLPEPAFGIRSWYGALAPGGRLSVAYWPSPTETTGPFALLSEVQGGGPTAADWETDLIPALRDAGATVERDDYPAYPMAHPSAAAFFDAFVEAGPGRALAIAQGPAYVAELRAAYLDRAPEGEWTHRPRARLIVARR